jgi:PHD-finger
VLAPVPGEKKPYYMDVLKALMISSADIPVCIPTEQRLANVIDDKGARYCLCDGPSDGRLILSCDQCDQWFHGHCVKVPPTESDL